MTADRARHEAEARRRQAAAARKTTPAHDGRPGELPPIAVAAIDLIRRTGAVSFELRYSDEESPVVWMAIGSWERDGKVGHEVGASLDATRAILRLCENAIDGGTCVHCERPAGFEPDSLDTMPASQLVCWYQYDPELKVIRRGCESE